jgi:hypothetical protein
MWRSGDKWLLTAAIGMIEEIVAVSKLAMLSDVCIATTHPWI